MDPMRRRLWVVDSSNHRLLGFDLSDGLAKGEAVVVVLGQPDFTTDTVFLGAQRTAFTFNRPGGIAVQPGSGKLYVAQEDDVGW